MKRFTNIVGLLVGLFFIAFVYVGTLAMKGPPLPERLRLTLWFLLAPTAIFGVTRLRMWLISASRGSPDVTNAGALFLVIAFAFLDLMLVVQQTIFFYFRDLLGAAHDEVARQTLWLIFRLVNSVQLGIDITFDVFYCLGIIFVSLSLFGLGRFVRIVGGYGILSALGLFAFNMWTFPKGPADAGLVDLGPATAVWWIAVILLHFRHRQRVGGPQPPC